MANNHEFHINIAGKVNNTRLPQSKPLWPLFEAISNSIHSLEDHHKETEHKKIEVRILRLGDQKALNEMNSVESSSIKGFEIVDNGVGFNETNFDSFLTSDSDYKVERGAKGIGRFVCLKAFTTVQVDSIYTTGKEKYHRRFDFRAKEGGIFEHKNVPNNGTATGTKVSLLGMREKYQKHCPKSLLEIAENIIEHFLVNFILGSAPVITLVDTNGTKLVINKLYEEQSKSNILTGEFTISENEFKVHLVKLHNVSRSKHEVHYCANERDVLKDSLGKYIADMEKKILDISGEEFVYHAYVTGKYLDEHVDSERTGFNFASGEEDDEDMFSITQKNIRDGAVACIEELLVDYLTNVRDLKISHIQDYIKDEAPQYAAILKHRPEALQDISPETKGNKLNVELFKALNNWEIEVREKGEELLKPKDDITDIDEYKKSYEEYVEEFNDVGKANLAKYIVHRKSVIDLLENFLGADEDGVYKTEDAIHNIFFPIRKYSDDISYDKQNLWLIDERLSYHSYLSSDKSFKEVEKIDSDNKDRTDLMIFNDAFAFVDDKSPHNSITIVEFKRPERDGYSTSDPKKNPIDQVTDYIHSIREMNVEDRRGKIIDIKKENTPFYVYVVCDFDKSLVKILDTRDYKKTPDGAGYFKFHDTFNAYIEVISYSKVLKDAKKRNNILFDKLGLSRD